MILIGLLILNSINTYKGIFKDKYIYAHIRIHTHTNELR